HWPASRAPGRRSKAPRARQGSHWSAAIATVQKHEHHPLRHDYFPVGFLKAEPVFMACCVVFARLLFDLNRERVFACPAVVPSSGDLPANFETGVSPCDLESVVSDLASDVHRCE